jgi:hypothetical protein
MIIRVGARSGGRRPQFMLPPLPPRIRYRPTYETPSPSSPEPVRNNRFGKRTPLDVEAAVAELGEIANGRGDLLAERTGLIFAFHEEDARDGRWPRRALEAALCIAARGPTRLTEWIGVGQERAERIR